MMLIDKVGGGRMTASVRVRGMDRYHAVMCYDTT